MLTKALVKNRYINFRKKCAQKTKLINYVLFVMKMRNKVMSWSFCHVNILTIVNVFKNGLSNKKYVQCANNRLLIRYLQVKNCKFCKMKKHKINNHNKNYNNDIIIGFNCTDKFNYIIKVFLFFFVIKYCKYNKYAFFLRR